MIAVLLGKKLSQTQMFTEDGKRIPVTVVSTGSNWVTNLSDTPDHKRVQLGFGSIKNLTKPEIGHLKKAGLDNKLRFLRSFTVSDVTGLTLGGEVKVEEVFQPGVKIRVQGVSKGKGFGGVVRRHHFKGGPRTHGQSDRERAPGSIGQTTTPGRVYRGKRMAGRTGNDTVTVRNLSVVSVDPTNKTITIKGLVPGGKQNLLVISKEN